MAWVRIGRPVEVGDGVCGACVCGLVGEVVLSISLSPFICLSLGLGLGLGLRLGLGLGLGLGLSLSLGCLRPSATVCRPLR